MEKVQEKYDEFLKLIDEINQKVKALNSANIIFSEKITVQVKFSEPELCFNNLISWLYILGHEATGRNLDFIVKKFNPYGIALSQTAKDINKQVHAFRTVLQHNLDLENSKSDIEKNNLCQFWFNENIQKDYPDTTAEWSKCDLLLLEQSEEFYKAVLNCVNQISSSINLDVILDDWEKVITRNHSVYEYEQVLIKALENFGLNEIFDTNIIAKKYKDEWRKDIDLLPDGFVFEVEVYKIVERFLLRKEIVPIDGNDLINLGVNRGPALMKLLIEAKNIFNEAPCSKIELLEKIKKIIIAPVVGV